MNAAIRSTTLLVSLLLLGCGSESGDEPPPAELVVINADVRTVDPESPRASAFAVTAGRFVKVGDAAAVEPLIGATTEVVDAAGATVVPGFVDGHTHILSGSRLATGVDLTGIPEPEAWLERVARHVATLEPGDWVVGGAWDHNLTADKLLPSAAMLDRVTPENPVAFPDIDGHTVWVNSRALDLAGITADTVAPPGGEVLIDPATGLPSGILLESARELVFRLPSYQATYDPETALKASAAKANALGVTTVHDMSGAFETFATLAERGALSLRVWQGATFFGDRGPQVADELARLAVLRAEIDARLAPLSERDGPRFAIGFVKSMMDGVLSTRTALLLAPYADDPEARAEPITTREQLLAIVNAAHANGFPVAVHAIGDAAVADTLDVFSMAADGRPADLLPDRVEHIELVALDDVLRFRDLGVVASMHPHHVTCCMGNYILERIGEARIRNAYVWRDMLDNEVTLVLGTDWPTATFDPLEQIADTLFREDVVQGNGVTVFDNGMTLTFDEALHAYAQAGADNTTWGDEIGSITRGKWADFVLLDGTVENRPGPEFRELSVSATYLGGTRVF